MSNTSKKSKIEQQNKESVTLKEILKRLISIIITLVFMIIPFLHNIIDLTLAQFIWYPSLLGFILIAVVENLMRQKLVIENPFFENIRIWGEVTLIPIFLSVFVFNYYTIDYIWHWVIFIFAAIYMPAFFINLMFVWIKNNEQTEDDLKIIMTNICKHILLCLFIDLLYLSIFNDWLVSTLIFGILAVTVIFFNVTSAFLNNDKSLRFFIVLEFLLAVAFSIYLIYIIPDAILQNIVLTITAAIYGGFLTLVGVAWTIKKTADDKYSEDRKKAKPFIGVIGDMSEKANVAYQNPVHFCKKEHGDSLRMKLNCYLQNSDKCIFYLDKVQVDDIDYYPDSSLFINKNEIFAIFIMEEPDWEVKDKSIRIFITDINYEQRIFEILPGTESRYEKIVEIEK